jgi:hypothetical protein
MYWRREKGGKCEIKRKKGEMKGRKGEEKRNGK